MRRWNGCCARWLRTERDNLEATYAYAHTSGLHEHTLALAAGLAEILCADGPYDRTLAVLQTTAETAERHGHLAAYAMALTYLGGVRRLTGDLPRAADALTQALDLHRALDDPFGEAVALTELGTVRRATGDLPGAGNAVTRAVEIYRASGNRTDEAWALNHHAAITAANGDQPRALALYHQALAMNRELNKPTAQVIALEGLGDCHLATGETETGVTCLKQALAIFEHSGTPADTDRVRTRLASLAAV